MTTNLSYLADGYLELESDPGLFTLLIEDFGCKNVQVEEIYDLSKFNLIDGKVYGFIFLFKYFEERRSRHRQMFINNNSNNQKNKSSSTTIDNHQQEPFYVDDEQFTNSIFFAHQIIPNSCATHALLSVLLNCNIELGENLNRLKENTRGMDAESKGLAISNIPELAKAHNQHASEIDTKEKLNKQPSLTKTPNGFPRQSTGDSFHFISFVNINNRVYELDGLKKYPIDHGEIVNETFSEKFRKIILERIPQQQQKENKLNLQLRKLQTDMNTQLNEDIRYSLMAVVPDRRKENIKKLKLLKSRRLLLTEFLNNLVKSTKLPEPYETHSYSKYSTSNSQDNKLELNLNKFIIKDNNNKLINNNNNLDDYDDDDNSTDTCSECDSSRFSDDDCCLEDENNKMNNLYAIKFMPLKEQNNDNQINNNNNLDDNNLKIFSKNELTEFYSEYGLNDLLNILKNLDQEINICDLNINEEMEKKRKFYVDDSRRTYNYNEFISTYLLMLTEQKKLYEFIDSKDNKLINNSSLETNNNNKEEIEKDDDNLPNCYKFFKEILTNYEDVIMKEEEEEKSNDEKFKENKEDENNILNNTSISLSPNSSTNQTTTDDQSVQNSNNNKRKYSRRSSSSSSKINLINKRSKEKIK